MPKNALERCTWAILSCRSRFVPGGVPEDGFLPLGHMPIWSSRTHARPHTSGMAFLAGDLACDSRQSGDRVFEWSPRMS